jgi:hypothetical protein
MGEREQAQECPRAALLKVAREMREAAAAVADSWPATAEGLERCAEKLLHLAFAQMR